MQIRALVDYCDQLLDARSGKDFGPNGLQVEGHREDRRIATGVSACVELFERAREAGADAVLVHHGLLWDFAGVQPIVGHRYRRLAALIESGLHQALHRAWHAARRALLDVAKQLLKEQWVAGRPRDALPGEIAARVEIGASET